MSEYLIATSVLEEIVRGSVAGETRYRLHGGMSLMRSGPVVVSVENDTCRVVVQLDARLGENVTELASEVRGKIADSLGPMTGLAVSSVDVVVSGVFSAGS